MRLTAKINNTGPYERFLIKRLFNLTEPKDNQPILDLEKSEENQKKYNLKNEFLETIIFGTSSVTNSKSNINNIFTKTIDLILTPYIHNDRELEDGIPTMEVRPEYGEIPFKELPDGVIYHEINPEFLIVKAPCGIIYGEAFLYMTMKLFYKSKSAEEVNSKPAEIVKYAPMPTKTIKIDTAA